MSRRTKAAHPRPLHPLYPQSPLAAALLLTPLALAACSAPSEASRSQVGPLSPADDPVVRVVPLDDPSSPSLDASSEPPPVAASQDGGVELPARDGGRTRDASTPAAPEDDARDDEATAPAPARPSDAGAPRTGTTVQPAAASSACVPAAPGAGTLLGSTPTTIETAAGPVQVSVQASGPGCPPCTSRTTLAPDGETFTTVFSAFEVAPESGAEPATKQCTLSLELRSTAAHAYAITSLAYEGSVSLQQGQSASQVARHQVQDAADAEDVRTELSGPRDGAYTLEAPIEPATLVWSECGLTRDLTVSTTLSLTPGAHDEGRVSLSETGGGIEFKLDARTCTP